jgi:hypothetical protein
VLTSAPMIAYQGKFVFTRDLLLKSAFERIFNVMQLILVLSDILSENI